MTRPGFPGTAVPLGNWRGAGWAAVPPDDQGFGWLVSGGGGGGGGGVWVGSVTVTSVGGVSVGMGSSVTEAFGGV